MDDFDTATNIDQFKHGLVKGQELSINFIKCMIDLGRNFDQIKEVLNDETKRIQEELEKYEQ